MGEVKWEAYRLEDINWSARSRVEALTSPDREIGGFSTKHKTHTRSGAFFTIGMLIIFILTWWKWM